MWLHCHPRRATCQDGKHMSASAPTRSYLFRVSVSSRTVGNHRGFRQGRHREDWKTDPVSQGTGDLMGVLWNRICFMNAVVMI